MKHHFKHILLGAILATAVVSCGPPPPPRIFGVTQTTWNHLSPSERRAVIKGYNQRQKINAQNAPLDDVISATSAAVRQQQYQKAWEKNSHNMMPPMPPMPNMPNP